MLVFNSSSANQKILDYLGLYFNPNAAMPYEFSIVIGGMKTFICCSIAQSFIPNISFIKIGAAWYVIKRVILDRLLSRAVKENYHNFFIYCLKVFGARVDARILLQACKDNETDLALRCLKYGANPHSARFYDFGGPDVRYEDMYYTTALHAACFYGNKDIVDALINAGVDINDMDYMSQRPLCFACQTIDGLKLLNYLIEKGAHGLCRLPLQQCLSGNRHNCNTGICCERIGYFLRSVKDDDIKEISKMIPNIVSYICNKKFEYCDIKTKSDGNWLISLLSAIYRFVDTPDEKYNLLQKLCGEEGLRKRILQYVVMRDDKRLISCEVNHDDGAELIKQLFLKACTNHKPKVVTYLYSAYKHGLLPTNPFYENYLCEVVSRSAVCFTNLVVKNLVSLKDLHEKNKENKTVFYVGVQCNAITSLDMCEFLNSNETKEGFLHQELLHIARGNSDESVEKVVRFCINNGVCLDHTQKNGKQLIDTAIQVFDKCDNTTFERSRTVFNLLIQGKPEKDCQLWRSQAGSLFLSNA